MKLSYIGLAALLLASPALAQTYKDSGGTIVPGVVVIGGAGSDPAGSFARPANTTPYAAGQLIASSTVAASVVPPTLSISTPTNSAIIPILKLATNATTGWATTLTVTLWTGAPTYSSGDGATYAVATSGAGKYFFAQYACTLAQFGDGAGGSCSPTVGNTPKVTLPLGAVLFWDLQATAAVTPISGQTFTLTAEVLN